jgi:CBS domain-containing protein
MEQETMKVHDLMTKTVKACGPTDTLNTAAHLMWTHDCGCIPVTDPEGHVQGMLTDRDICMAAYTRGAPLEELHVADAMSANVYTVAPHETLARAERLMAEHQVRRLPVVGETGRLIGLLSISDLARATVRDAGHLRASVSPRELSATIGTICKPRVCPITDAPVGTHPHSKTLEGELMVTN